MDEGTGILPGLPAVAGKPVHLAFDGGQMTSDAGILLLAAIEQRLGIAERLADCIEDPRAPERVRHTLAEMIRFRALLIAAGYPDGNDCDALRADPAFKMAVGRLPESGEDLCSQPTMSRLENLPGPTALKRMMAAMVELFCDSFEEVPRRIVLDIDDTEDRVHGGQQLSLFNAHYDSRCFLPIHIYEATTGKPVAVILRPARRRTAPRWRWCCAMSFGHIRARWPAVEILVRGDSHYGRREAMAWCERNRVGYIFGLAGNKVLLRQVGRWPRTPPWAASQATKKRFAAMATSATPPRAGTSSAASSPASRPDPGRRQPLHRDQSAGPAQIALRKGLLRARAGREPDQGHKLHLASDRTSCTKATANQFRLLIHTAAYWLMHTLRGLAPHTSFWRDAQFDTLRLGLIKVAVRVTEMVTRIKIALPTAFPISPASPSRRTSGQTAAVNDGAMPRQNPFGATSNPITRVADAAKNRARSPPSQRDHQSLMNDPG